MVLFCDEEKERVEAILQSVTMNESKTAFVIEHYFRASVIYVNDFFNNHNGININTNYNTEETIQVC